MNFNPKNVKTIKPVRRQKDMSENGVNEKKEYVLSINEFETELRVEVLSRTTGNYCYIGYLEKKSNVKEVTEVKLQNMVEKALAFYKKVNTEIKDYRTNKPNKYNRRKNTLRVA